MQSKDNTPKLPLEVGRLTIRLNKGSYLETRFQFNGVPYTLAGGKYTPERLEVAIAIAQEIDSSITFRTFNGIEKYKKQTIENPTPISNNIVISQPKEITLLELWEQYRDFKFSVVSASTSKCDWNTVQPKADKESFERMP